MTEVVVTGPAKNSVCGHTLSQTFLSRKFADICCTFVHSKSASMSNTFQLKNHYKLLCTDSSNLFSNFPGVIRILQLSASTMMLEEVQLKGNFIKMA